MRNKLISTKAFIKRNKAASTMTAGIAVGLAASHLFYKYRGGTDLIVTEDGARMMQEGARGTYETPYGLIYTTMKQVNENLEDQA